MNLRKDSPPDAMRINVDIATGLKNLLFSENLASFDSKFSNMG